MGRRVPVALRNRLRAVREARGLSQAELARAVGISRQALQAIESGRYVPNTAVALRLSQALGCAVEDLFATAGEATPRARLAEAASSGRVRLGRVRSELVAWPLGGPDVASPADGTVAAEAARQVEVVLLPGAAQPERTLFVAGCDPALRIAGALASSLRTIRVHWIPASSARALQAVREGLVHVAGTHLHPPQDPEGIETIRRILGRMPVVVVSFARWVEGVMMRPGARIRRPEDLLRPGVRIVNREEGSGSRLLFDRWLRAGGIDPRRVRGYGHVLPNHLAVAEALSAGFADAAPGVLPVARSYGLEFLPIAEQRYDLVVPQDLVEEEPVRAFLDVLHGRAFRRELEAIDGYDPAPAGSARILA